MQNIPEIHEVLPHAYVKLLSVDGNDRRIAQRARLSFDRDDDKRYGSLVHYLVRHRHSGPLEFCSMQFEVKAPLAIVTQLLRHRTLSFNQVSARYVPLPEEQHAPTAWRTRPASIKQGSTPYDTLSDEDAEKFDTLFEIAQDIAAKTYNDLVASGVAPEQARFLNTQGDYTRVVVKADLNNLFKYILLRTDSHAQLEHRVIAKEVARLTKEAFPVAYAAFEEYQLNAVSFSRSEVDALLSVLTDEQKAEAIALALEHHGSKSRAGEFRAKLELSAGGES